MNLLSICKGYRVSIRDLLWESGWADPNSSIGTPAVLSVLSHPENCKVGRGHSSPSHLIVEKTSALWQFGNKFFHGVGWSKISPKLCATFARMSWSVVVMSSAVR